jgi:hypothetical protein
MQTADEVTRVRAIDVKRASEEEEERRRKTPAKCEESEELAREESYRTFLGYALSFLVLGVLV